MRKTDAKELIALTLCPGFQPLPSWGGGPPIVFANPSGVPWQLKTTALNKFQITMQDPFLYSFCQTCVDGCSGIHYVSKHFSAAAF